MNRPVRAARLDAGAAHWPERLRALRKRLAHRATLLPHHFLEVTLPKIGGALFALRRDAAPPFGYAFLLPRGVAAWGAVYTLRYEHVDEAPAVSEEEIVRAVEAELASGARAIFYRPAAAQRYTPSHIQSEGLDCGRPDAAEAAAIRAMQQAIWRSPPQGLYPSDLHSDAAGLGCSLVARVDGALAGFLLGFYRIDRGPSDPRRRGCGAGLRLESQLLAVAPDRRGRRIGHLLKRLQARQALAAGIDRISWTTDPLLFANAALNFTHLRAFAYEFQPSLYPFHNELNRLPAARLSLLWPLRTRRVQNRLESASRRGPRAIGSDPNVTVVNRGDGMPVFNAVGARIAIEIPDDWAALQRADRPAARRWREVTDRLLRHYLGLRPGQYIITDAGVNGARRYLVGERVDERLLADLFAATDTGIQRGRRAPR